MKGLTEITLLDSTHNLGLRCKLERDLFRVVERLSADTGEATCKETVNAIGLTRRIGKQDGNFRPLVGRIPRLFLQLPSCRLKGLFSFFSGTARQLTTNNVGCVAILTCQKYFSTGIQRHDMNPFLLFHYVKR